MATANFALVVHIVVKAGRLIFAGFSGYWILETRDFDAVMNFVTCRVLAIALLFALVAKPCIGIISATAAPVQLQTAAEALDVTLSEAEETSNCKKKCPSGRVEKAPATVHSSITLLSMWQALAQRPLVSSRYPMKIDRQRAPPVAQQTSVVDKQTKKLAMLSRFLL